MKLLAILCFTGLALCVHGLTAGKTLKELLSGLKTDVDNSELTHGKDYGHCVCPKWGGCWCHGYDDNVKVQAEFSVEEVRHSGGRKAVIVGTFFIGTKSFNKEFPANQFEDFCETVGGKRFCFRIDINDNGSSLLKGCLSLSRPHKVFMGCFNLPLLTSTESSDSIQDFDLSEIEMEASAQLDKKWCRRRCACCEHGCYCQGIDDGYRVVAILSLDECKHDKTKEAIIYGLFKVDKVSFSKAFHEEDLEDFCHIVEGKKFCFEVMAKRFCSGYLRGRISLTAPQKVELGCFSLPLMTSSMNDVDVNTEDQELMSYTADDVENNEDLTYINDY